MMIKLNFKQITCIKTFLLASTISFFALDTLASKNSEDKVFNDWVVKCEKDKKTSKQACSANQILSIEQNVDNKKKQVPVVRYQFFLMKKELHLVQILPQSVLLQPGSTLVVDKKPLVKSDFTFCYDNSCYTAATKLSDKDKKSLLSGKEIFVGIFNIEGKQVNLQFSNKGLKKALSYVK